MQIYANVSVTSEEDEIIRKEREILEILEVEERRNYETDNKRDYSDLGGYLPYLPTPSLAECYYFSFLATRRDAHFYWPLALVAVDVAS